MEMDAKMHEELGNISPFKHHLAIRLALIEQFQRVRVSGSSLTLEIIKVVLLTCVLVFLFL